MVDTLYSELEPYPAQWTRELMGGPIGRGIVEEGDIKDVQPGKLREFRQCHFFSGLSIWPAVLRAANWPDHLAGVTWTGSCPCFVAGTLVLTRRGYLPIESVQVGDEVLTHKGRWRSVTAIGSDTSRIIELKGQGHWGLTCTPEHPFLTGDDEWTDAADLVGKRWHTVASVPAVEVPEIDVVKGAILDRGRWRAQGWKEGHSVYLGRFLTRAEAIDRRKKAILDGTIDVRGADSIDIHSVGFAKFLGYWIGDGWVSGSNVIICGALEDGDLLRALTAEAGMQASFSHERTTIRARIGSKILSSWLTENFGFGASEKRLPTWIHGMPDSYRRAFLEGYALADGHREGDVRRWTTVSRALAVGVRILLNQEGTSASITLHTPKRINVIEGRIVSEKSFYRVTAYPKARSFKFNGVHGLGYVRSTRDAGYERVYNIAVEEDESYTADGIAVHNCQPFSAAGRRKGFADERHLWPHWFHLIDQCQPDVVFGEQIASKDGLAWIEHLVQPDMEAAGYSFGVFDLCAAGFSGAHIRQRLYFVGVANTYYERLQRRVGVPERGSQRTFGASSLAGRMADSYGSRRDAGRQGGETLGHGHTAFADGSTGRMADSAEPGRGEGSENFRRGAERSAQEGLEQRARDGGVLSGANAPMLGRESVDWLYCRDDRWRPFEAGNFPLAAKDSPDMGRSRTHKLKGYGNALDYETALGFVEAVRDTLFGEGPYYDL